MRLRCRCATSTALSAGHGSITGAHFSYSSRRSRMRTGGSISAPSLTQQRMRCARIRPATSFSICGSIAETTIRRRRVSLAPDNGQLQSRVLLGERRNQSPVVKISCSKADPSNKAYMHFAHPITDHIELAAAQCIYKRIAG